MEESVSESQGGKVKVAFWLTKTQILFYFTEDMKFIQTLARQDI